MVHLLTKFQSRITTAIDPDDLSIVLASVTDIPIVPFMAILEDTKDVAECVWVTDVTVLTKTLTVTRGHRGTTAVAHAVDALFFHSEIDLADLGFHETWITPGDTGRPFESQLITDVLLGGWANGLKGYVDCRDTGGSTGLLSGVNGEIRLPDSAGRGSYYALEGEVVLQEFSRITPWGSSAGFLFLNVGGHSDGVDDFDDDGRFMSVNGLTPEAGHLLSADLHTLKSSIGVSGVNYDKFLVLSLSENILHHNVSELAANGRIARFLGSIETPNMPDGQGLFDIQVDLKGGATGHFSVTATWLNIPDVASVTPDGNYVFLHNDGFWASASATITNTFFAFQKYHADLVDADNTHLHIWNINIIGKAITALIEVNDPAKLGFRPGTSLGTDEVGTIPIYTTGLGAIKYLYVYPNPAS